MKSPSRGQPGVQDPFTSGPLILHGGMCLGPYFRPFTAIDRPNLSGVSSPADCTVRSTCAGCRTVYSPARTCFELFVAFDPLVVSRVGGTELLPMLRLGGRGQRYKRDCTDMLPPHEEEEDAEDQEGRRRWWRTGRRLMGSRSTTPDFWSPPLMIIRIKKGGAGEGFRWFSDSLKALGDLRMLSEASRRCSKSWHLFSEVFGVLRMLFGGVRRLSRGGRGGGGRGEKEGDGRKH